MSASFQHPDGPLEDVVIAGAGIVGATLALGLAQSGLPGVRICDPLLANRIEDRPSFRAVALAPDARQHLEALGVWAALEPDAQPIRSMVITDGRVDRLPHPAFLTFEGAGPDAPIGHMILTDALKGALLQACAAAGVVFEAAAILGFREAGHSLALTLSDGGRRRTRLLVAADGARSRLRHAARIQTTEVRYPQTAIVATLRHDVDHGGRATQHFLPAGPIALLPLRADDGTGRRTSLVWTTGHGEADRLLALDAAGFVAALHERIGFECGPMSLEDRPVGYPLQLGVARRLTAPRVALLGDAARTIHPLAGQGLNLGLRDAAALTQRIGAMVGVGLDPGSPEVLAAYERDRRVDGTLLAGATDGLNRLFSNDSPPLRALRDIGLGLVDRAPALKRSFARGAGTR